MNLPWSPARRRLALALAAMPWLAACEGEPGQPLRIGAQVFPGYEFLFLAQGLDALPRQRVRLVEMPSASASIRALGSGAMDGACLTLDEVISARSRGIALTAVAVLDVSLGADVLLARPGLHRLADLRGRTVGVEPTAVGAVMLHAALAEAGLQLSDVRVKIVEYEAHERAFLQGGLDAVITYEPVKSKLLQGGAGVLFSSARMPGRIMDVLAVREDLIGSRPLAVRAAVDGHFHGRDAFKTNADAHLPALAERLRLPPARVPAAYAELDLPDRARNRTLFATDAAELRQSAVALSDIMQKAGLLPTRPSLDRLFDGRFL